MRRQFSLPESDVKFLEQSNCQWEAIRDLNCLWVLIHGFAVPAGYNYQQVTVAVMIPDSYPDTSLDMVYFSPDLIRLDGRAIRAIHQQTIDGKSFQRWSRHYTAENPWRPGVDDLSFHLTLVSYWLERELEK
ncbi:MAG: hypothetical protein JST84_11465 [Acidobacteria bacterium]|nr:hypothetical protein [Acidobacteriota bacterium]